MLPLAGLWKGLTLFLDDPRIPLDNNATERGLRGVVLGRKNHYGSRSERGTEVAAPFYSLLKSAKLASSSPSSTCSPPPAPPSPTATPSPCRTTSAADRREIQIPAHKQLRSGENRPDGVRRVLTFQDRFRLTDESADANVPGTRSLNMFTSATSELGQMLPRLVGSCQGFL